MTRKDVTVEKDAGVEPQGVSVRGQRRRRVGAAVSSGALAVALVGCSSPDPDDQRERMLAASTTVADTVISSVRVESLTVLDDGTEPVSCPSGGVRYQYVVYGWTNWTPDDSVDDRLDDLTGSVFGGIYNLGDRYYTRVVEVGSRDGEEPRQLHMMVEDGPDAGVSLTVDAVHQEDGAILVRFAGTTACG